tara:strand:+ start:78 stop:719 length:642 start_codon:yes stop_codon:yes gene_type:complete
MLQIKNLSFGFNEIKNNYLIKNLSFKVKNGEIKLIYGKSGLGKSTLLNLITGIKPSNLFWTGKIFLDNKDINYLPIEKRKIGLLMQERFLFPHFRVKENLMFAMPKHFSKIDRNSIIKDALTKIKMNNFDNFFPHELSGGQITRIACLRTLLSFPKAILLDEPFSSLDPKTKNSFKKYFIDEVVSRNIPCLIVTHDKEDIEISNTLPIELKNT